MTERKKSASAYECAVFAPRACPLCERLQSSDVRPFHLVKRPVGSLVLRHGAKIEQVLQLRSGRIKLSVADASGTERAYTMRGPGSLLGLEALLGMPALFDGRVELESELVMIEPAALERFIESGAVPVMAVVKHVIAENVRLAAERLLGDGHSEARLARFLLEREADPFLDAWKEAARHEVAGLLSMRPETLSRAIRVLQDRAAIGPGLEIKDTEELRRIAREDGGLAQS